MSQTLCNVLIHCVFHAKPSAPHIQAEDRKRLNTYALEVCQKLQCPGLIANGPGDHLHLLISLSTAIALSTVIKEVKRNTSVFLKTLNPYRYTDFHWQRGYGAFSVSIKFRDTVYKYIADQEEHHLHTSSRAEFEALLHNAQVNGYVQGFYWEPQCVVYNKTEQRLQR